MSVSNHKITTLNLVISHPSNAWRLSYWNLLLLATEHYCCDCKIWLVPALIGEKWDGMGIYVFVTRIRMVSSSVIWRQCQQRQEVQECDRNEIAGWNIGWGFSFNRFLEFSYVILYLLRFYFLWKYIFHCHIFPITC